MALLERAMLYSARLRSWVTRHFVEIALAALFALPFAYAVAAYLENPEPFTVYVIADSDTNKETLDAFREKMKVYPLAHIGDVNVQVKLRILPENTEDAAQAVAEELSNTPDTLMVIGSGRSQLVEKSLPVYFKSNPRIPYIATTATDDALLKDCDGGCYENNGLRSLLGSPRFAPLLQLSPTNRIQASSAIEFAIENGKHRFLIVTGNDSQNRAHMLTIYHRNTKLRFSRLLRTELLKCLSIKSTVFPKTM
jgi:hypothetical protein